MSINSYYKDKYLHLFDDNLILHGHKNYSTLLK